MTDNFFFLIHGSSVLATRSSCTLRLMLFVEPWKLEKIRFISLILFTHLSGSTLLFTYSPHSRLYHTVYQKCGFFLSSTADFYLETSHSPVSCLFSFTGYLACYPAVHWDSFSNQGSHEWASNQASHEYSSNFASSRYSTSHSSSAFICNLRYSVATPSNQATFPDFSFLKASPTWFLVIYPCFYFKPCSNLSNFFPHSHLSHIQRTVNLYILVEKLQISTMAYS